MSIAILRSKLNKLIKISHDNKTFTETGKLITVDDYGIEIKIVSVSLSSNYDVDDILYIPHSNSSIMFKWYEKVVDSVTTIEKFTELEEWEKSSLVSIESFVNSIKHGMGVDGSGFYSNDLAKSNKPINLNSIDQSYSHIVWYDK